VRGARKRLGPDGVRHAPELVADPGRGVAGHPAGALERLAGALAGRTDAIREQRERLDSATGGRAYLERRRLEQLVQDETERFTAAAAREIDARVRAAAGAGVLNPVQARDVTGRDDEMFMNAAYLLRRGQDLETEVATLGTEYGDLGVSLELTGPWPPYNFVPRALGES
jgi:hypothetical protein